MKITKVRIFANQDELSREVAKLLEAKLQAANFIVSTESFDLGISIGGDGAFLRMLREVDFLDTPYYVGINTGSLGFIQDFKADELNLFVDYLKACNFHIFQLVIPELTIESPNENLKYKAINEFSFRDANLKSIHLDIFVDSLKLEKFAGDGLLIATPFGSTAYNLSQGGSIIYPEMEVLEVTPFAPINNAYYKTLSNSFIISRDHKLTFEVENSKHGLIIQRDSEKIYEGLVTKLEIKLLPNKIKCLVKKDYSYTDRLKDKIIQK